MQTKFIWRKNRDVSMLNGESIYVVVKELSAV